MRNNGKYALHYHLTPEQGLLNDPNGLCYFEGYYHVFYQYNPHATDHSVKYWGHVRSKDLVEWEQLPIALKSEDWFDGDGVYSGSAVVHEGVLYLFYTGNTKDERGIRKSYQCLATSTDGIHFKKHGPITEQLSDYTGHVRDPKVWYDTQLSGWWMLLGAQKLDRTGDTVAFFSQDLYHWTFRGSILQFDTPLGYMWECPDMIFLTDEATQEQKAVFIFSPQGIEPHGDIYHNIFNTTYLVGTWDAEQAQFIPDNMDYTQMPECDRGFEFYAPQTFVAPDGRVVQYGWAGTMWPEVESVVPTIADNWIHQLTIARVLSLKAGKLQQQPVRELADLVTATQTLALQSESVVVNLTGPTSIEVSLDNAEENVALTIDQSVSVVYHAADKVLRLTRQNWHTKQMEHRQVKLDEGLSDLEIWLDTSSIECFVNRGEYALTARYFAEAPLAEMTVTTSNKEAVHINCHSLKSFVWR